ncbi:MAG: ATP-binding protein, partial [Candidatus Woesearchaeota archaeon]
MIQRDVFKILEEELHNTKITVVTGARQIGKSTALHYVYAKVKDRATYITFDDTRIKDLFENHVQTFIEQYITPNEYIFLDEFQYVKDGGKILKFIHDTTNVKIYISGSSKPEIAVQSLQCLVGRVSLVQMHPLSFSEFIAYRSPQKQVLLHKPRSFSELSQLYEEFDEFLRFGGYPDVVKEPDYEKKKKILKDIVQVYLLKEIKDVLQYTHSTGFEKLLQFIATTNGKLQKIIHI